VSRVIVRHTPVRDSDEEAALQERQFRKAMALKDQIGLSREERYSLAQMLHNVSRDFDGSWQDLDSAQLHELITMMEGWVWITHLMLEREDG
jgi:hypothetical protein